MAGAELSTAGFVHRPAQVGDPMVCQVCGLTIGYVQFGKVNAAEEQAEHLVRLEEAHKPECAKRLELQRASRTNDGSIITQWEIDHPGGVISPEEQAAMDDYTAQQEGI